MRVLLISTIEQWQEYAKPWDLLTHGIPLRGWKWLSTWWRHYGDCGELAILAVLDDRNTLVGAAPWYVESIPTRGRILRMLGCGEVCSDYPTVLCTPEFESQVAAAVSMYLVSEADRLRWDLLEMDCVPHTDSAVSKLAEQLELAGCSVLKAPGPNLWNIELPTSWQEYLGCLSTSHRKQINRLIRDYCETGRARWEIVKDSTQLQRAMTVLVELHQRRWQRAGEPGVFASKRFAAFLQAVAEQLLPDDGLQLSVLELDGRPAAVDYHLVNSSGCFVYQGGIEPDLVDASPGKLLTALLVQEAIQSGKRSFDFLRGDEPYKPHFRATPTETVNLHVIPKRTAAQLRHGLWMTGLAMKNLVKSGLTLTGMNQ